MLKQQQPGSGGRKASNGTSGPSSMSSTASGTNTSNRTPVGRSRASVKPPFQSSPGFDGVYNNARMLHFLTAVVGSTCDIKVKNGSVYEGIFKTLSSRCELAVDAVHKRGEEEGSSLAPPRREEITDTMIFSPSDLVTMICRDVDLNYATRDTFTDTGISSTRVNGDHKEKVLQRWEGGDSNGESYDLENDAVSSNGWDANEMFRFNEVNYGVKSTYDASLSAYTVPLERGSTEGFRQREARATRLASEIESSPQYRHRVSLENEEGKSEEEKYSAVVREREERERGRESPRDRERGRDSPGIGSREGKYIPLPQRAREMGVSGGSMRGERAERGPGGGPGGPPAHNRMSGSYRSAPPSSSPRPPLPSATGPQPASSPSERSSPLSGRGGGYSPHHPQGSPSPGPSPAPTPASPPTPHGHTIPHSHSLPHSLADSSRPVNGVSSRTSPKAQRAPQSNRSVRTANSHSQSTASRSPKSGGSQDSVPYLDTSVSMPAQKTSGPAPTFPVDVNEILNTAAKERSAESPSGTEDGKTSKAPSVQQRSQIEDLRKFSQEFRLQPSGGGASAPNASATAPPPDAAQPGPAKPSNPSPPSDPKQALSPSPSQPVLSTSPSEDPSKDSPAGPPNAAAPSGPILDRQSPATPQPARTPGSEEATERGEGVADQVKKSTLNPNAKEFNPVKLPMTMSKPSPAPTPPRPTPPSPVVLPHPGNQAPIYNAAPYLSYIHSVQPPQMYQYMSTVNQGKYPRAKVMSWSPSGSVVAPRSDHGPAASPMLQAAASAAGASLVASPYPQSYLQYNPQQYSQQQVLQAMAPYPAHAQMYSMLQSGGRMISQGGGHPQAMGPPGGPQFPVQGEGPQGPQQGIYAPQSFSHHTGAVHQPQPSSTPTGNQPPPQHAAPSPGQNAQSGPQPQSLYHSGPLSAPTPPNMPPGHTSPQASYPTLQGYSLHGHQGIPHSYPLGQLTQAHVQGAMSGPHHAGTHGHPQVVMLQAPPPQQGPGSMQQHPQHGQQGAHQQTFYIGHPQPMVQQHPSPFHPPGN